VRISNAAMVAALTDLRSVRFSKARVSLYESYLTAKWLEANGRYPNPEIADVNDAMSALLDVVPDHTLGRLYPFRWDWLVSDGSGRKTVWNNTTRSAKLATSIFASDDLRNGLLPNAATVVATALEGEHLPSRQALICLLLRNSDFGPDDSWATAEAVLLSTSGLSQADLNQITDSRPLGVPLLGDPVWNPKLLPPALAPPSSVTVTAPPGNAAAGTAEADLSVVIDARVERMLRRCVEHYPCIMLVGPPGTGKGTLVRWLVSLVAGDPAALGFDASLAPNPMWRTPDESWSSFDLVGGLAPDEQSHLVWSNGLLLNALKEQRWLVLDETNRADLDKIMGPLLTWLSNQQVEVGRTKPHGGTPIQIGWTDSPASTTDTPDPASGEPTRFLAGADWRLLGTYNPQDAQRVFRMGQALSRRFVIIPIPALAPGQFESLVATSFPDLSEEAKTAIGALYSAHHGAPETLLGPAVFLRLGEYLAGVPDDDLPDCVAEAYVTNVGKFISAFDDATFDRLGTRIVDDEQAMSREQWEWTATQRLTLG
jgi:hypothetical protein